jgi:hypothetical protein
MIRMGMTRNALSGLAKIIGIASSEVDKYTAMRVQIVTILLLYKAVAITENPHCGSNANRAPMMGQY